MQSIRNFWSKPLTLLNALGECFISLLIKIYQSRRDTTHTDERHNSFCKMAHFCKNHLSFWQMTSSRSMWQLWYLPLIDSLMPLHNRIVLLINYHSNLPMSFQTIFCNFCTKYQFHVFHLCDFFCRLKNTSKIEKMEWIKSNEYIFLLLLHCSSFVSFVEASNTMIYLYLYPTRNARKA